VVVEEMEKVLPGWRVGKFEGAGYGSNAHEVEISSCLPEALARHEAVPSESEVNKERLTFGTSGLKER
jgi:hypothetical protein